MAIIQKISRDKIIECKNITVGYSKIAPVIFSLSLTIYKNDFFGIIGPNGCGKTTLLRTLLSIIPPLNGEVFYFPNKLSLHFGYVPQIDTIDPLFPLTVSEIVMMGRYKRIGLFKKPKKEDYKIVQDSLKYCGIENLKDRLYQELSGGEKQRTLIARALSLQPDILVLDEPTHNMDLASEWSILELLKSFNERQNLTIIIASHLISAIANFTERLLLIKDGKFLSGDRDTVLTEENLSKLYGLKVRINEIFEQKFISVEG